MLASGTQEGRLLPFKQVPRNEFCVYVACLSIAPCWSFAPVTWMSALRASSSALHGAPGRRPHRNNRRNVTTYGAKTVSITQLSGEALQLEKDIILIGSGAGCDVLVQGTNIAAEHAIIERKRQQLFCKAMVGEDMFDSSACLLDGTEMRPKVSYLLGTGSIITVGGPPGVELRIEFEQGSGSNPMMEMMMQGMMPK